MINHEDEVVYLSFVLPVLHLNIHETEKMWQKNSRRAWHVIPAQEELIEKLEKFAVY